MKNACRQIKDALKQNELNTGVALARSAFTDTDFILYTTQRAILNVLAGPN